MLNKNVATYTDFLGKTNKKIVQAPGGASSLSLAWGNQKIDYGPSRQIKNLRKQVYTSVNAAYQPQQNIYAQDSSYMQLQPNNSHYHNNYGYKANNNQRNSSGIQVTSSHRHFQSESVETDRFQNDSNFQKIDLKTPIKVMDFQQPMVPNNQRKSSQQQGYTMNGKHKILAQAKAQKSIFSNQVVPMNDSNFMFESQQRQTKNIKKPLKIGGIGGQFGYSQTKNFKSGVAQKNKPYETPKKQQKIHVPGNYSVHSSAPQEQIDLAVQEQSAMKSPNRRSNSVQNEGRSCIKIIDAPPNKLVLGDATYNFWKQDLKSTNYIKKSSIIRTNKEFFNQKDTKI